MSAEREGQTSGIAQTPSLEEFNASEKVYAGTRGNNLRPAKPMSRRDYLRVTALTAAAGILSSACSPATKPTPEAEEVFKDLLEGAKEPGSPAKPTDVPTPPIIEPVQVPPDQEKELTSEAPKLPPSEAKPTSQPTPTEKPKFKQPELLPDAHITQPGDTFTTLEKQYGVPVVQILRANTMVERARWTSFTSRTMVDGIPIKIPSEAYPESEDRKRYGELFDKAPDVHGRAKVVDNRRSDVYYRAENSQTMNRLWDAETQTVMGYSLTEGGIRILSSDALMSKFGLAVPNGPGSLDKAVEMWIDHILKNGNIYMLPDGFGLKDFEIELGYYKEKDKFKRGVDIMQMKLYPTQEARLRIVLWNFFEKPDVGYMLAGGLALFTPELQGQNRKGKDAYAIGARLKTPFYNQIKPVLWGGKTTYNQLITEPTPIGFTRKTD